MIKKNELKNIVISDSYSEELSSRYVIISRIILSSSGYKLREVLENIGLIGSEYNGPGQFFSNSAWLQVRDRSLLVFSQRCGLDV